MKFAHFVSSSLLLLVLILATSCSDIIKVTKSSEIPESSYCTTNINPTTFYTITGNAKYQRRKFTTYGLGSIDSTTYPIRRAEVQVLDSTGAIVQCTETTASGTFSFKIPDDGATYTIKVLSRSYNQYNKASILNDPTNNIPYSISTTFVADTSKTVSTLIALATDANLKGAAFNILDQIYKAHDYLLNNTGGTFTVNQKIQAYWSKGVNPVTYFGGDADSGVSFYIPGTNRLYILGGVHGDITVSDTDHFDDSIIIHEFGHFVEDNYSKSDSPGGTHYGLYTIDPRLAWSEGFATYFASQVLNDPIYKDTYGYNDSDGDPGTGYNYYYDMENNLNENNNPQDMPTAGSLGEGGFRELAVSRSLWASTHTPVSMPFSEFWSVYTGGFKSTLHFRELSLFLMKQAAGAGTDISSLYDDIDKELDATRLHYGAQDNASTTYTSSEALCKWTIQAVQKNPISGSVFQTSNQYYSNDFFYYYHSGGNLSVKLNYDLSSSTSANLDLYIYKDGYEFGVGSDLLTYSNRNKSIDAGTESVNLSAPAGYYMINVMYSNDGAGSPATTYNLNINNNYICR